MKKTLQGTIVSLKTPKTASVLVERKWQHPMYGKFVKRSKKYACHFEGLKLAEGDTVTITEIVPVSKTKRFKVIGKVEVK